MSLIYSDVQITTFPYGVGPSNFINFTFKGDDYIAIINSVDNPIVAITLFPSGQQLKLYYSNGIWLVENRVTATNVKIFQNPNPPPIHVEDKTNFTGSQLTDLNILVLLEDPDFNALCRTNRHLSQLCKTPALQNDIYKERIIIHMPNSMKYVIGDNYKEVYQDIRRIEKTELCMEIRGGYWDVGYDTFNLTPNSDDVEKIIYHDDITALRYLIDIDKDNDLLNLFSTHYRDIAQLLAEYGAIKILTWLVTVSRWGTYFSTIFELDFVSIITEIVKKGIDSKNEAYIKALVDSGLYTGDPSNPVPLAHYP